MEKEKRKKRVLVIKASEDICGNEMGLIGHQFELLGIEVKDKRIKSEQDLTDCINESAIANEAFDYVYLCTHGDRSGFSIDYKDHDNIEQVEQMTWAKFGQIMCQSGILTEDTIFLLACCKGGLFQVATDILSVCNKINFVCGVKWTVHNWDLTTGFIVFIYNLETKNAEPSYAAKKASLATDYTFECYDRDEVEMNPQYAQRQADLYYEIGWIDKDGNLIETDPTIIENIVEQITFNKIKI